MAVIRHESHPVQSGEDVVMVRQKVRDWAIQAGFSLVDQTKIVTAASELARNVLQHGKGGAMRLESLNDDQRRGLRLTFEDEGPGIPNVDQALRDGYSTGGGLGLGLGGAKRLSSEFSIDTQPGRGTKVVITRWK
jgi:serine/threonine-protein kinase RsbT